MTRYKGDEVAAKNFLYDVIYFPNSRSHVMLTVFFDCWPEVMFWTGSGESVLDPLLETVVWCVYNGGPSIGLQDVKVALF